MGVGAPRRSPHETFVATILAKGREFMGLRETASNRKWDDARKTAALLEWMGAVGWQPGWAYCIAGCEALWRYGYVSVGLEEFYRRQVAHLINPSVMQSYHACDRAGRIARRPEPGDIFFMQMADTGRGHAGIVEAVDGGWLLTMEANTSAPRSSGDEREGDGFFPKRRLIKFDRTAGLHLVGFCHPPFPE